MCHKVDSREILRMDPGIGTSAPAYRTGPGKAILAFLPAEELDRYLNRVRLEAFIPNTITSVDRLLVELQRTRARGFAVDSEAFGVMLRCAAAPVTGYGDCPHDAISVSGPSTRLTDAVIERIAKDLGRTCARLSVRLGTSSGETGIPSPLKRFKAGRFEKAWRPR